MEARKGQEAAGSAESSLEKPLMERDIEMQESSCQEGVRNFKELRAKFQKCDAPPLLGPVKFPASVSQKGDIGCTWPTPILAPGKPCPSNHNWPQSRGSSSESQNPQTQHMKLTQRSKIQKSPSSLGLLEKSTACSPGNSQVASLLLDVNSSNAEMSDEEKEMVANSFQDKLRKWEKVSSQKGVMFSALLLASGGDKAFRPENQKSMRLLPDRPRGKIQTKWAQTLPLQKDVAQRKVLVTSEKPPSLRSQASKKNQEKPSVAQSSEGGPCQPVYELELTVPAPGMKTPVGQWEANPPDTKHHQLPRTKPLPPIGSLGPAPPKPPKPPAVDLQAFQRQPAALTETQEKGKETYGPHTASSLQATSLVSSLGFDSQVGILLHPVSQDHGENMDMKEPRGPPGSAEFEEPHNYEATILYLRHSGNSINLCPAEEIADSTYEVGIEELQKPWKSFLHQELRPKNEDEDKHMQAKKPCELQHQKSGWDPPSNHPFKPRLPAKRSPFPVLFPLPRARLLSLTRIALHQFVASIVSVASVQGAVPHIYSRSAPELCFPTFSVCLTNTGGRKYGDKEQGTEDWWVERHSRTDNLKLSPGDERCPDEQVDVYEVTLEDIQRTGVHRDRWSMAAPPQETVADDTEAKARPEDVNLARPSRDQGGCVETSELTAHTQDPVAFKSRSVSQATYDDVDGLRTDISKSDFSSSFTSESKESSEEMYDDVYKTKSNSPQIDLDGKEALKRLQHFFKKEKDRFKMKAIKSKENLRAFSVSLPDLQLRSQEVTIYDDVNTSERESNDEDKMKTWRPNFLSPRRKKEKSGAKGSESFSPGNFFRTKKQNYLEKNRVREEKLFRQRFQYDKEITVINRAVACSNNSRNGIFDLPVTPGEELEVIDTTDQNMVLCRNSKGKYGYVLIEHLDFKHQGWSP
ncbi:FYN-binding protein 2 [Erethizon dorsatum]